MNLVGNLPGQTAERRSAADEAAEELFTALVSAPSTPDWETLMTQGTVPSLALGAERRLRR